MNHFFKTLEVGETLSLLWIDLSKAPEVLSQDFVVSEIVERNEEIYFDVPADFAEKNNLYALVNMTAGVGRGFAKLNQVFKVSLLPDSQFKTVSGFIWTTPDNYKIAKNALLTELKISLEKEAEKLSDYLIEIAWASMSRQEQKKASGGSLDADDWRAIKAEGKKKKNRKIAIRTANLPLIAARNGLILKSFNGGSQFRLEDPALDIAFDYYPANEKTHIIKGVGKGKRSALQGKPLESFINNLIHQNTY